MENADRVRQTIIELDLDEDCKGIVEEAVGQEYLVSVDEKVNVCCFADDPEPVIDQIKATLHSYDIDLPEESIEWSTIEYEEDEDF